MKTISMPLDEYEKELKNEFDKGYLRGDCEAWSTILKIMNGADYVWNGELSKDKETVLRRIKEMTPAPKEES